jgi:predicted nucleic acid-binding protein
MASEPPVAVYDACVLYPFHLRNVLVQCAFDGLVEARWTDEIHSEWMRNLADTSSGTPLKRLEATRDLMKAALPDADVACYETLIPSLSLPDPDDRHILAAAIAGKASLIVTWNLKHFPTADLRSHGVAAISPDGFLVALHSTFRNELIASTRRARLNLRKTLPSAEEFIEALKAQGLTAFSAILRRNASQLV